MARRKRKTGIEDATAVVRGFANAGSLRRLTLMNDEAMKLINRAYERATKGRK